MRVAEQAEGSRRGPERAGGVELVEDVGVFVKGRAVADLHERVDVVRPFRQLGEPGPVIRRQLFQRPSHGVSGDGIEAVGRLEAACDLVVVPADDRQRIEQAHALDHGVGIGAVADQVAENQCAVVAAALGVGETGLESLQVCMDVGQD
jgi:hypothetical protein